MGVRLGAGYLSVLASAVLLPFGALGFHIAGYAAGTLIAFTLAAVARRASLTLATETGKPEPASAAILVRALVVLGFIVGVIHAWYIARALS